MHKTPKFIFIIGGVLSGIGKGITTASIALLIKSLGYKVTAIKIDPYISIDAGTMRPAEHGEVFVTDDGGEIDQDIGHYERFLNQSLTKQHNITTGKVFANVIANERQMKYRGHDASMFPDVINEIKRMLIKPLKDEEVVLVEIGGTTGDLENKPFLHAARELGREYPSAYVLVTFLPFLKNVGELKTKPTQHAVAHLRETGIFPDFIITRGEIAIDHPRIETIATRSFIDPDHIIDNPNVKNIYEIPLNLEKAKIAEKILHLFDLKPREKDLHQWKAFVAKTDLSKNPVTIALVGKYTKHGRDLHKDVYISVLEALTHAAAFSQKALRIVPIDSSDLEKHGTKPLRKIDPDGIVVPQGWGSRGVEGKILASRFAREQKIPYLGLCFGMQLATVEFARNVVGLKNANSEEVNPKTAHPVIHIMPDQKEYLKKHQYGGTIRLGSWPCVVKKATILHDLYRQWGNGINRMKNGTIEERHRHRYEVNNKILAKLTKKGYVVSGMSPDGKLVEAMELRGGLHPFFLGTQFHPEYKSRPFCPHPIFIGFIKQAAKSSP
ncbi:CTP synthase [Patescibacteria group bacterium]|nr:CTP synthase [Patescibacteria group bacterium]